MKDEKIAYFDTGKRLSIEPGGQLQIEIEGVAFRFKTTFVGMESDEYLIIKTPKVPLNAPFSSIKHKLFQGNQIVIRYLYKGTVFGFQSKLIEALSAPKKLLFVEYPKIIEQYDLRSNKRIDCLLPVKANINDKEAPGVLLDITEKGCRYLIKAEKDEKLPSVKIDDQITLRCHFPGMSDEQVVSGSVRNINMDKQETTLGIQFQEMAADIMSIIVQYISTINKEFS